MSDAPGGRRPERFANGAVFDALADSRHVGLWQLDEDGRTLWMNRAMREMLGVAHIEDIGNRTIFDFIAPSSLERAREERAKRARGEASTYEIELLDGRGRIRSMLISAAPVPAGPGRPGGSFGTFLDLTELRAARGSLAASEANYRRFFDEALTGNFLSSADGRILDCNAAYARIFGFASVADVLACPASELYPDPAARESYLAHLERVGAIDGLEVELRRRDGEPVWVVENVRAEYGDDGRLARIRGYLFDVTERRRLHEQLLHAQKMEAVGRLAGGVAHDFNNTLTALLGHVELLEPRVAGDPEASGSLSRIRMAAEDAVALTRQLLAFGRRQVLAPEVLDPNEVVADVEAMVRRLIPEAIRVEFDLAVGLDPVRADRGQLRQVLVNLVVNARDAMPDGGRLRIATGRADVDGVPHVRLEVRDDGHGMDAAVAARVFEPFFSTKADGGTGLGLATAYGIVRQSGGDLRVTTAPGEGATFEVLLPAVAGGPDPAGPDATPGAASLSPARGETVLLVEDEAAVREVVGEILVTAGYRVLACPDGSAALLTAESHAGPIDLVLTDVVMPGMNGPETADRIREIRPGVPVLFMSGYTPDAIVRHGVRDSEVEFLAKPFRAAELIDRVRDLVAP